MTVYFSKITKMITQFIGRYSNILTHLKMKPDLIRIFGEMPF